MIGLTIRVGSGEESLIESDLDTITIGRGPWNDITLDNPHISGTHGQISKSGADGYLYRDLNSTNGSLVQHKVALIRVHEKVPPEQTLQETDEILLGDLQAPIVLLITSMESPSAEPDGAPVDARTIVTRRAMSDLKGLGRKVEDDPEALRALYRLTRALNAPLKRDEFLDVTSRSLFSAFAGSTHCTIFVRNVSGFFPILHRSRTGRAAAPEKVLYSRSLLDEMTARRASVLFEETEGMLEQSKSLVASRIRSGMCAPLWRDREIWGILQIDNRRQPAAFTEGDLDVLSLFASQLNIVLENLLLHETLSDSRDRLFAQNAFLKGEIERDRGTGDIVSRSPQMKEVLDLVERLSRSSVSVLIQGETGTGKEVIARLIHRRGTRSDRMFVPFNCSAVPETLIENELFGHVRGAFTGADSDRKGLFEIADGGTVFLDEIGSTPLSFQAKLLRVLQEGEIRPIGSHEVRKVDVQIISATNCDLEAKVSEGLFREDLFYRVNAYPILIGPLRERREDIPALVEHFLDRKGKKMHKTVAGIEPVAMKILEGYGFPGNVRELENEIERLVTLSDDFGTITVSSLSDRIRRSAGGALCGNGAIPHKEALADAERSFTIESLARCSWNISRTSREMGMTRHGLKKKMTRLGIRKES